MKMKIILFLISIVISTLIKAQTLPPPQCAATVMLEGSSLTMIYDNKTILSANQAGSTLNWMLQGRIDTNYNCQLFCIREKQGHPQALAKSRHIS